MFLLKLTTPRLQMCLAHRRLIVVSLPFSHHIAPLFIPSHHLVSHLVRCSALTSHPIEINKPSYANRHVCISSNRLQSKVKHCIIKSCINMVKQQTNKEKTTCQHMPTRTAAPRRLSFCKIQCVSSLCQVLCHTGFHMEPSFGVLESGCDRQKLQNMCFYHNEELILKVVGFDATTFALLSIIFTRFVWSQQFF